MQRRRWFGLRSRRSANINCFYNLYSRSPGNHCFQLSTNAAKTSICTDNGSSPGDGDPNPYGNGISNGYNCSNFSDCFSNWNNYTLQYLQSASSASCLHVPHVNREIESVSCGSSSQILLSIPCSEMHLCINSKWNQDAHRPGNFWSNVRSTKTHRDQKGS